VGGESQRGVHGLEEPSKGTQGTDGGDVGGAGGAPPAAPLNEPESPSMLPLVDRLSGFSYGMSSVSTLISSGTTRTRQIRAPKQLDI
jgi:hypothetical protein